MGTLSVRSGRDSEPEPVDISFVKRDACGSSASEVSSEGSDTPVRAKEIGQSFDKDEAPPPQAAASVNTGLSHVKTDAGDSTAACDNDTFAAETLSLGATTRNTAGHAEARG